MEPTNDMPAGDEHLSIRAVFVCFVSGAKFGIVVAVLAYLILLWSNS